MQRSQNVSPSFLARYEESGYVTVPNLLPEGDILRLRQRARDIVFGDRPPGFEKTVVKDISVVRGQFHPDDPEKGMWKLMRPDLYDSVFRELAQDTHLQRIANALVGFPVEALLTMFIYKPPQIHSVHPFHQDAFYLPGNCSPDQGIGVWIPLDDVTEKNGTLEVIPKSHTHGLLQHAEPQEEWVNKGMVEVSEENRKSTSKFLELNAGDAVFFHPLLVHATGPNKSMNHRRVVTIHYFSVERKLAMDAGCLYKING